MADTRIMDTVPPALKDQGIAPVTRFRVYGTWIPIDSLWAEVHLGILMGEERLHLTAPYKPLQVARRYSGKEGDKEVPELSVISALKSYLTAGGAHVLQLTGSEAHTGAFGAGVTEWRYWAWMGSKLTVALEPQENNVVRVIGLN